MSIFKSSASRTKLGALVASIGATRANAGTSAINPNHGKLVAGIESLDAVAQSDLLEAGAAAEAELTDVVEESGIAADMSEEQKAIGLESASIVRLAAANASAYGVAARATRSAGDLLAFGTLPAGNAGSVAPVKPALESFDVANIENHMDYSIAYNLLAPRQDTFGETLFPTIVGTPDQAMFKVSIERTMVYQGAVHKLNGDIAKFDKKNILEAYRNADILKNEATVLVPYVQAADANASHFVAATDVATYTRLVDGVEIPTRPLKMNAAKPVSLIGISSAPGLVAAGLMDQSDAVDHSARLSAVYMKVTKAGSPATVSVVKINTLRMPKNQFIKTREGHGKDAALRFYNEGVRFTEETKTVAGAAANLATDLGTAGQELRFAFRIDGDLNFERGDLSVRALVPTVAKLIDADTGAELVVDGAAVLTGYSFELIGYDIDARRTNSNRRSRGLLLDRDVYEEIYEVGLLPPMSIQKPATNDNSPTDLQGLINATHIQISNSAVTTLLNYAEFLENMVQELPAGTIPTATASSITGGDFEGIARMLVTPFFEKKGIDLEAVVNNIASADKLKDISGHFVGVIQELSYRMAQRSGYIPALEAMVGNGAKPKLIIATDTVLPQFIMIQGDDRTAGIAMDHVTVSSPDTRMIGKIVLTFGRGDGFDPLQFGNLIWIPELISTIPVNRQGATVEETMVQPRFRHVCNLPVMALIEVTGLDLLLSQRTSINFHEVV